MLFHITPTATRNPEIQKLICCTDKFRQGIRDSEGSSSCLLFGAGGGGAGVVREAIPASKVWAWMPIWTSRRLQSVQRVFAGFMSVARQGFVGLKKHSMRLLCP